MAPALKQKVARIERYRGIRTVELFLDNQAAPGKVLDRFVIRHIAGLKAGAFNMPRARVFREGHDGLVTSLNVVRKHPAVAPVLVGSR